MSVLCLMKILPEDLLNTLEFDRILGLTAEHCLGEPARIMALRLKPVIDPNLIRRWLEEVHEYSLTFQTTTPLPLSSYHDIQGSFRYLEIIDYVLDLEDLLAYRDIFQIHKEVIQWWDDEKRTLYPTLFNFTQRLPLEDGPLNHLNRIFDAEGQIRNDASENLALIRRKLASIERQLEKVFGTLVSEYRKKGWLSESSESVKNGRRVLTVPAEHKRKIKGIIHDESASGKTVFLEPEALVELNNDLFDLESEEKQEIHRILKALCNDIRPYKEYLEKWFSQLIRLDLIRAKALTGRAYQGVRPEIIKEQELELKSARHPLLMMKYQPLKKAVVPFDLKLDATNRILVLSGPNAGGKSITMKTVMLLQILTQTGFLIPVKHGSRLPIFLHAFADIGDQQSLEDDLSTYSSKLRNMQEFMAKANRRTLVALDEMGTGTDPQMGGPIAEAVLDRLNRLQVMGVVTTHYSNLKLYAFKQKGMVNGSMIFNQEKLAPTYEMRVGKPGSSYAFEIAMSSGIPENVLQYARKRAGMSQQAVEQLLIDLQNERRQIEEKQTTLEQRERQVDQLIQNYEKLYRDLEFQRKKFKIESKEKALMESATVAIEVEKIIKEVKEERNLEKAKEAREKLRIEQERLREQMRQTSLQAAKVAPEQDKIAAGPLREGSFVRLRGGGISGQVLKINKEKAKVNMGEMTMVIPIADLEVTGEPLDIRTRRSIHVDTTNEDSPATRLDLRGFKPDEATKVVELFLDKALMSSSRTVRIIHGVGTGALRKVVYKKVKEYRDIKAIEPASAQDGGEGVSIIYFS